MIRTATEKDIEGIARIYDAIHTLEERGTITVGWRREAYPTVLTAKDALARGDLYVYDDGGVLAAAIINHQQLDCYRQGRWMTEASDDKVLVLHTLVIAPEASGRGVGTEMVAFYERMARLQGCIALRMDTQEKNVAARRLYARLGYTETDIIDCDFQPGLSGIRLVLLEKRL